ncbi:hypothetical protein Ciccas_011868 [Cichlidogyrus casuarinus]|uniref:ABC-2 type transporter transmembrane domain-containing protein n=1 Tax=Cichlidogyrus casuarinus TaxID=1844966 RepID=A0ABD2PQ15_9PLAT
MEMKQCEWLILTLHVLIAVVTFNPEAIVADSSMHRQRLDEVAKKLADDWLESNEGKKINDEAERINSEETIAAANGKIDAPKKAVSFNTSFMSQLRWVCWRTGLNLLRDPNASIVQTLVYLFFAISMGVVYYKLDTSLESGIQNRAGLFFFSALQVIFVNLGSIEMFIKERVIFIHENSSGYYRVSSYFLAKIVCDIVPTKALPIILFMVMTYFMVALRLDAGAFFFFELILVLTTLSAAGIALLVSASVTMFAIANIIVSITYVFMMVFGGYLINLNSMGVWLSWLRYLSIFRYCWSGLLVNEMPKLEFCPRTNLTQINGQVDNRRCQPGAQYLQDVGIPYETAWDLWVNVLGMSILMIVFYVGCYVQLRRINKYK